MSLIHYLADFAQGGVTGVQSGQRDWSPFLVHFTSYRAMKSIRVGIRAGWGPETVRQKLFEADEDSFSVVREIASSRFLRKNSPSPRNSIPECVCFSECTLPGLIAHAERYGRFGFVFDKFELFHEGARPCLYLGDDHYGLIAARGRAAKENDKKEDGFEELFGLSNVFRVPSLGLIQDYTHEREWRLFGDLSLRLTQPILYICPSRYVESVRELFGSGVISIPIDIIFKWGI